MCLAQGHNMMEDVCRTCQYPTVRYFFLLLFFFFFFFFLENAAVNSYDHVHRRNQKISIHMHQGQKKLNLY